MELSKYISAESVEIKRSELSFASYNPRILSKDERAELKRGIKNFGLVGGLVVNKRTGMTIVGGHQRISVMDELHKYDPNTHSGDYLLRVDLIDVSEKKEKELNILLNNPNAQGKWDDDALRRLIPDIDYKSAGLTEEDLSLIGIDFTIQTEEEASIVDDFQELYKPIAEKRQHDNEERSIQRKSEGKEQERDLEDRIQHIRNVKAEIKEAANEKALDMQAYITISFDSYAAKEEFCVRFGYNPQERFIKGEIFSDQIERIDL